MKMPGEGQIRQDIKIQNEDGARKNMISDAN
jgi:hypothetical protein